MADEVEAVVVSTTTTVKESVDEEEGTRTAEKSVVGEHSGCVTSSTASDENKELSQQPNSGKRSNGGEDNGDAAVSAQPFLAPLAPPPLKSSPTSGSSGVVSSSVTSPSSTISSQQEKEQRSQEKKEKKALRAEEKQAKYQQIIASLNYTPPKHAAPCADTRYNFEVLKTGTIVDSVKFSSFDRKGYYIIGRVPGCDIVAENPTVSRLHAILQFIKCPKDETKSGQDFTDSPQETGLYLYDLKSTHGTFLNKNQLFPHKFYRVHVGHVLKFGSSQRMYIVNGPDDDEEEESDKSVTELQNEKLQKDLERKRLEEEEQLKRDRSASNSKLPNENIEEVGINWGMAEDADEESDMRINPFAMDYEASDLTLDNPKKTLRSWFEREGHDLQFEMRDKSSTQFICRVGLPIDGPTDGPVYAESEVKGKKKEAVRDAAMKACQILDSHGLLRTSNQESRKRKEKKWADEDYYSSDEDTYLDRTGSVEKKREKRMRLAGKASGGSDTDAMTYDSLCSKHAELEKEITDLQGKIEKGQTIKKRADDGEMDVDDYVNLLKTEVFDVKKLKARLKVAQEEVARTKKLMQIAKPAELPSYLQTKPSATSTDVSSEKSSGSDVKSVEEDSSQRAPSQSSSNEESSTEPAKRQLPVSRKPIVGPMKPPAAPPIISQPKRFGLITPANFAALKSAPIARVPASTSVENENEDDVPFQEEHDSSSSDGGDDDAPSNTVTNSDKIEEDESIPEFTKPTKKKRQRYRNKNKQGSSGKSGSSQGYQDDPNYSEWVPPTGQSGDGRTSLNEKLGY